VGALALPALPLVYLLPYQAHRAFPYGSQLLSSAWQRGVLSLHVDATVGSVAQTLAAGQGGFAPAGITLLVGLVAVPAFVLALLRRRPSRSQFILGLWLAGPALIAVATVLAAHVAIGGRYLLPLWLPVGLAMSWALSSLGRLGLALTVILACIWIAAGVVNFAVPEFASRDDTRGAARSLGIAATHRLIAIGVPWDVMPFQDYRPQTSAETRPVVHVRELDVIAMPVNGEPAPSVHQRPSSLVAGTIPKSLRLAQVIRGPTFLVERFVAARPVSIRIDGRGPAFTSHNWRFLAEPAGGRMGGL
jgi:hypothetical protein